MDPLTIVAIAVGSAVVYIAGAGVTSGIIRYMTKGWICKVDSDMVVCYGSILWPVGLVVCGAVKLIKESHRKVIGILQGPRLPRARIEKE